MKVIHSGWLEPFRIAIAQFSSSKGSNVLLQLSRDDNELLWPAIFWGCSSVGRAVALQAIGQEFDSPQLHQSL